MKKGIFIGAVFLLVCLMVVAGSPVQVKAESTTSEKTFKLMFGWDNVYAKCMFQQAFEPEGRFERLLDKKTAGRLKLDIKPRLFPPKETLFAAAQKRCNITSVGTSYYSGSFPIFDIGSLPFIVNNIREYEAIVLNPEVIKIWKKAYRKIGVEYLASFPCWVQDGLWGKTSFRTIADFKGKKIRTSGLMQELAVKAIGGEAISMPSNEMEEALYRGTIDGLITGRGWGYMLGLFDISPNVSVWPLSPVWNMALVVNSQSFNSLPSELQQALQETAEEIARQNIACAGTELAMMIKAIELAKIKTTIPSKEEFEQAIVLTKPVYDKWLELTGSDGEALLDAAKESVKRYRTFIH